MVLRLVTLHGPKGTHVSRANSQCSEHTKFHKEPHRRRRARSAVGPEDDIVVVRVPTALEKVEEQVTSLNIDVACVCTIWGVENVL